MKTRIVLALCLLLAACGTPPSTTDAGDARGSDALDDVATTLDATPADGAFDGSFDVSEDAASGDSGGSDSSTTLPAGCNPDGGIECDGDWEGQCSPACAASECCSPQHGRFACVPRDAMGRCPAADLWVDRTRIEGNYSVEWRYFEPNNCAIMEGCVNGPGWRRLLRFDTWTPNTGTADMYLGVPRSQPYFEYSACHMHYHFNTYAAYELRGADGSVAARGHKQAFCLLDYYQYPGTNNMGAHYTCGNQGIQMGWQDVYGRSLDCQWVDVTDVPAGDYTLHIAINTEHLLNETDYSNNEIDVPVSIPPVMSGDPTAPCTSSMEGLNRECGWTLEGTHRCTPGAMVTVGCSARCGLGSCTGDPMIRVCPGTTPCNIMGSLASNDDSGCGGMTCRMGMGECCSQTTFTCPAGGQYAVLWAPYRTTGTATCNIATR